MASGSPQVQFGHGILGPQGIVAAPLADPILQRLAYDLVQATQHERQTTFHVFVTPHQRRGQTEGSGHAEEPKQHGAFSLCLCMMNPCLDRALDVVGMAQFQGHEPSKSSHVVHCRVCRKGPFPTAPSLFKLRPVQLFHDLQCAQGPCTGQGMSTKGRDVPQGGGMRKGFHVGL